MIFRAKQAFTALLLLLLFSFYQLHQVQQRNLKDALHFKIEEIQSNYVKYSSKNADEEEAASELNVNSDGKHSFNHNDSIVMNKNESLKSDRTDGDSAGENFTQISVHHTPTEAIQINANCTLAEDIEQILHYPELSMIEIHLKNSRRCDSPSFRGRISGQRLSMLDWSDGNVLQTDDGSLIIGGSYYNLPPGKYFLEIIALMCSEIKYEEDFSEICLEDPAHHRVTVDDAVIEVIEVRQDSVVTSSTRSDYEELGEWVYDEQKLKPNHKRKSTKVKPVPIPVYTRFQPQNCRDGNKTLPRCSHATSIDRFKPYSFKWNDDSHNYLNAEELVNITHGDENIVVCALGASHSRVLVGYFNHHLENSVRASSNQTNITAIPDRIKFIWADAKYPKDVTRTFVQRKIVSQQCTHVVIGLGQWPAGWPEGAPTLFPEYKHQMLQAIENIKTLIGGVKIYLRSIHYNPIGDQIGACVSMKFLRFELMFFVGLCPSLTYFFCHFTSNLAT